ncbi:MAG TPA: rhodanese-like domain-containing protein, partial [Gaiellaceae bacterium]|nr:rhodanese-like domain-containing protein [Gaiellaceae bacterium]
MGIFGKKQGVAPREAARRLERGDAVLLDVREPDEWRAGHAPGALHIPLSELGQRVGELPDATRIVAVCRSGGRSARATESLRRAGLQVDNLDGGM